MKQIPLTKGKFAIVDADDYEKLSKHKWHLVKKERHEYAYRRDYSSDKKKGKMISMHREIMGFPSGVVDHINMNGLNNRKSNLRITTKSINGLNCNKKVNSRNNFKGVSRQGKRWVAVFKLNGVRFKSGSFAFEEEAAKSYKMVINAIIGENK